MEDSRSADPRRSPYKWVEENTVVVRVVNNHQPLSKIFVAQSCLDRFSDIGLSICDARYAK